MKYLFILVFFLASCSGKKIDEKKVIVIAVENLSFNDFSCSVLMDSDLVGFKKLCSEAIFYTHAYAPSTYTPSTLASLFTGVSPFEHTLKGPGTYLDERFQVLPESLLKVGYTTSLFSAGQMLFRNTGLDQGIEIFDDSIPRMKLHNTADELVSKFKKWHNSDKKKYFSLIYMNDPFYFTTDKANTTEGFDSNKYRNQQIKNVSAAILSLYSYLSQHKEWDNTTIIMLGLNGQSVKPGEVKLTNLYSENLHVPLLIKPQQKKRDYGLKWKIDKNISLIDVGLYLHNLFDISVKYQLESSTVVDISSSTLSPTPNWDSQRFIVSMVQTAHNSLKKYFVALRSTHLLYHVRKHKINKFNSLIDKDEVNYVMLEASEEEFIKINSLNEIKLHKPKITELGPLDQLVNLSEFIETFWYKTSAIKLWPIEFIYASAKADHILKEHFEYWALLHDKLNLLNVDAFDNYNYNALQNLSLGKEIKPQKLKKGCLQYFVNGRKDLFKKQCRDSISQLLWSWKFSASKKNVAKSMSKLQLALAEDHFKNKLMIQNIGKGYVNYGFSHLELNFHWAYNLYVLPAYKVLFTKLSI